MLRTAVRWLLTALGIATASAASFGARPGPTVGKDAAPLVWADLDGRGCGPVQLKGNAATVLVFFSTQCPVSNAYAGRVRELERAYFEKHVRFFLVDNSASDTPAAMRRYVAERHLSAPLVKDAGGALVERLGVHVTSEAVVLDRDGVVRYRGSIDDNQDPGLVHAHCLAEALDAVLAGAAVRQPWHRAVGCFIDRAPAPTRAARAGAVTYAREVAPILNRQCVECHRPGEVAPFSLLTYADARTWARQIKDATQRRIMPPWKLEPGYGDFDHAPSLTTRERRLLARWADAGAPAGDLRRAPAPPSAPEEWPMGKPDLIVRPVRPYHLAADGRDVYRCFVLPVEFKRDVYVNFCQFKPGNRAVVHHIILYADPTGECAKLAGSDPEAGFDNPKAGAGAPTAGAVGFDGWAPGARSAKSPEGVATRIARGSKLVMEVHYHRSGRPEVDQSAVGITFARGPITKLWDGDMAAQFNLSLPPGNPRIVVRATTAVKANVTLYSIMPHMHQIGKEMHVWAITPGGRRRELIWLKDWDFNWQSEYRYRKPLRLPKGTRIELAAVFDNAESNPRNPNRPARRIKWGEQTTDEMCIAFLNWTLDAQHLRLRAPKWEQCVSLAPSAGPAGSKHAAAASDLSPR